MTKGKQKTKRMKRDANLEVALDRLARIFEWAHECASRGEQVGNIFIGVATEIRYIPKHMWPSTPSKRKSKKVTP